MTSANRKTFAMGRFTSHLPEPKLARPSQVLFVALVVGCLGASLPARAEVPLYFPGHIPVDIDRTANRVVSLDYNRDGQQNLICGVEEGSILVISYFESGQFGVSERFNVGGAVADLALLPRPAVGDTLLAVATRNPDRLHLLTYEAGANPFTIIATVELSEDPTSMVARAVGPTGEAGLALTLAGIDQIAVIADVGAGWTILQELATGDHPGSVALVDFDADEVYEIITADSGALSGSFSIFRQDIEGLYSLESQPPGPANPNAMVTFDQDGDALDELYVTYTDSSFISVFAVMPQGLVEDERLVTPLLTDGLEVAFVTVVDLGLMCWNNERGVVFYFQRGAGQWSLTESFYTGGRATHVAITDLNADTYTDLAIANGSSQTVAFLFGNNLPSFRGYPAASLTNVPEASLAADVDHDGHLDLIVAGTLDSQIILLHGNGYGHLEPHPETLALSSRPADMTLLYADTDTLLDLAVSLTLVDRVAVFRGLQAGGFEFFTEFELGDAPSTIKSSDLDADGNDDLVVLNLSSDDVMVAYGAGDGSFADVVTLSFPGELYALCLVDLDGDQLMDITVINGWGSVGSRLNQGDRQFGAARYVSLSDDPSDLVAIDLDGDEDEDLVVANTAGEYLTVLENLGNGLLQTRVAAHAVGAQPGMLAVTDVNLDGHGDIVVSRADGTAIGFVLSNDDWLLSPMISFHSAVDPGRPVLGDFNEDTIPDVVVTDGTLNLVLTMLNVEPNPVSREDEVLEIFCRRGVLELTLRSSDLAVWWLEGQAASGWVAIADSGSRPRGEWSLLPEGWQVLLNADDLARVGLVAADQNLRFRLRAPGLGAAGEVVKTAPDCLDGEIPVAGAFLSVSQPHPNPFNPRVQLTIDLRHPGRLEVDVTDLAGRRIATLAEGWFVAGSHQVFWNGESEGRPAAAGVYLLRVSSAAGQVIRKAVLIK